MKLSNLIILKIKNDNNNIEIRIFIGIIFYLLYIKENNIN